MIKEVAEAIFPPDVKPVTRWRLAMAGAVAALAFHVAWACGLVPGLKGFALAADMEKVSEKVDTILVLSLEERMRDLKREICAAVSPATRIVLEREVAGLQKQHNELVGEFYPMPGC